MTTVDRALNSGPNIDQLLAKICERALERRDYETARDADCALRILRRWVEQNRQLKRISS